MAETALTGIYRSTDLLYDLHNPDVQETYTYFIIRTLFTAITEFKLTAGTSP